ncbi:tripartite tricarboxylate transporter substrate binding protein [Roseomonas alkaliterrae]|uniref:Tripartite-type tricarboxylate transporter receptor subunit TctC n=1 Tax=Neoroseomonas alkaliterrae TaxID=1452450 RepID=A0A840XT74_9PROT|nr:tripartite tricarboxylate transporter substrate binding protein [Neoroseomonas alkaliterrae]MBB5691106.1 tripartite-type tricarboxylate transporter receptor subunit TctC [Neoroseomonas alkaliterrae]MBR0678590.1 tripartite tricarboxylate transporter substrate binding protein [Neoroseomonas alkaliterrae]
MIERRALLTAAAALAAPSIATAQGAWPSGPIRIVVPFPPGGSTDALARLLAPRFQQELGVPIVVENRGGASGSLGTALVARAAPDGNTWLIVFDTHAVNPALIPNIGFDTQRDLTPLLLFGTAPMVLTAHRTRPYRSLAQVIEAAKARPETVTYGTIGNGSLAHLTMELAQRAGGFRLVHVPYRGGGPLAVAAVAGEVDLPIATRPALGVHIDSGAIIPLAQTSATRSPSMPDIPTFAEAGIPGIDARAFWGFLGPANLPAPIKQRMEATLRSALEVPAIRERVLALGIDLDPQGEAVFGPFIARQMEIWGRVVRENNIRPD